MTEQYSDVLNTHKMPDAHDFVEIAIAPPDCEQFMNTEDYDVRQTIFVGLIKRLIRKCLNYDNYGKIELHIEISLYGRLHVHGIIELGDKPQVCIHEINRIRYYDLQYEDNNIKKKKKQSDLEQRRLTIYRINDNMHCIDRLEYIRKDNKYMPLIIINEEK